MLNVCLQSKSLGLLVCNIISSLLIVVAMAALPRIATAQQQQPQEQPQEQPQQGGGGEVQTGNKPSTFNYRFNPYVRHNAFENDGEVTDYSVFMMTPVKWFGKLDGALVMEGPFSRDQDFTNVTTIPAPARVENTGLADLVIRAPMIFNPFQTGDLTWIPVVIPEVTLPTGSNELTADTFIISTGAGFVISSSPRWFVALIQFYDFDLSRTTGQPEVSRFRLRYFWQYLVSPKHRIYIMPEFQAVIDRKTREESYWLAPEIGKVISPIQGSKAGFVVYAKPGFGISNVGNSFERDWSIEVGVRWMWDEFPLNPLR